MVGRQFGELLLYEELRVQVSPFPKTRFAVGNWFIELVLLITYILVIYSCIANNLHAGDIFTSILDSFLMPHGATIFLPYTSAVKAHQFFTEESWDCFKQIFDAYMFEVSKVLLSICFLFLRSRSSVRLKIHVLYRKFCLNRWGRAVAHVLGYIVHKLFPPSGGTFMCGWLFRARYMRRNACVLLVKMHTTCT